MIRLFYVAALIRFANSPIFSWMTRSNKWSQYVGSRLMITCFKPGIRPASSGTTCRRHFKRSADHKKKISFIKLFIKGFKMLNEIAEQHDIRF